MIFVASNLLPFTNAPYSYTLKTKDPHDFEIQIDRPSKLLLKNSLLFMKLPLY